MYSTKQPTKQSTPSKHSHLADYEIPIGDTYKLNARQKLGSGAFGEIYLGMNIKLNQEVAIKLESTKSKSPQLFYESKLYMALRGGVGIPNLYWCGPQGNYNILIMDLLGPSLEKLFNYCNRKFTLKTTLMLADQMISRLEFIHLRDFLHRDVKPDNFLIGTGKNKNLVYAIDFGLAKKYRDSKTGLHIPYREGKSLTGTARYASVNTHRGIEQARRDDVESVGYIMVYFLKGNLPWQGLKAKNMKEKYEKIKEKKINTELSELCLGFPQEIAKFIQYTREIGFEDKPDYSYLHKLIKTMADNDKITFDYEWDWKIKKEAEKNKSKEENKSGEH